MAKWLFFYPPPPKKRKLFKRVSYTQKCLTDFGFYIGYVFLLGASLPEILGDSDKICRG